MSSFDKTPLEIFNDSYSSAKAQIESLGITEQQFHKLINVRHNLRTCFNQLNYIADVDKVELHKKISDLQLWALKIG